MIYFVYLYTIIWPKYMVVFHLFFLLFKTIWQKIWVLIDLFLSFAYDHWTKICGLVWYILSLCTAIQPKVMLLINLFILFVHDHSTKFRGHSYSLVYYFLNWVNILYAVFMAVLSLYFVHYIHVSTGLYFVHNVHGYMKSSAIFYACFLPKIIVVSFWINIMVGKDLNHSHLSRNMLSWCCKDLMVACCAVVSLLAGNCFYCNRCSYDLHLFRHWTFLPRSIFVWSCWSA